MIIISVLGLDQFVVGNYSRNHTSNIANIFETMEEDVNFSAPQSMIFHNGVEQTSWHTAVIIRAPRRFMPFEGKVANYILETLSNFSINIELTFNYFDEEHFYEHINDKYPRYIETDNLMGVQEDFEEEYDEEGEADPRDRADLDYNDESQLYLGDAFKGHEEELEKCNCEHEEDDCECDHDHCSCGHHHHHH